MSRAAGVVGDQAIRAGVEYSGISVATLTAIVLSSLFVFICGVIAIYLYVEYEEQKRQKNAGVNERLV
jgi:hypothetical protein